MISQFVVYLKNHGYTVFMVPDATFKKYLQPTPTIESKHPDVLAFVERALSGASDPIDCAVRLYYAVRDEIRYDPYHIDMSVDGLKASTTLSLGRSWCVPKSALLAAGCRSLGIPARLGYADVRNHLSTKRMREHMKTDIFYWHGYTSIYLEDRWVKATAAFNIELCEKFRLRPLEFDGRSDSIYHPFDLEGNRHMEYVRFRGEYADIPIEAISRTFQREYTPIETLGEGADFGHDVEQEAGLKAG